MRIAQHRRGDRHRGARRARPHARVRLRRRGRVRHHPRGEGGDAACRSSPTATSRRPRRRGGCSTRTGADGVMIGRAAQGRPWMFREIEHFLATGRELPAPLAGEIHAVLVEHLRELYVFYGRETGLRVARKHVAWYAKGLPGADAFRRRLNGLETCEAQLAAGSDGRISANCAQQQQRRLRSTKKRSWRHEADHGNEIAESVRKSLDRYFRDLDGEKPPVDLRHGAQERREADARGRARPGRGEPDASPPRCSASTATPCARRSTSIDQALGGAPWRDRPPRCPHGG